MKLTDIDPNFKSCSVNGEAFELIAAKSVGLEGFPWESTNKKSFCRLPENILSEVSEPLQLISTYTAGGVLRFCTDSSAVLLKGRFHPFDIMHQMPLTGMAGFDINIRENGADRFLVNVRPEISDIIQGKWNFQLSCPLENGMNEYRVYLPLYVGLESLQVGFIKGTKIEKAPPHKIEKPILYYGSSITQGGCASRPSMSYTSLLSSWVDAEQINLGFAGNAKGEKIVAQTIAELELSCFVMDYDHNAPTIEHLRETHETFFRIIREKKPDLPVILISRPFTKTPILKECQQRRDIIMQTYLNAKENGDENVYFIDGMHFFKDIGYELVTVDRCHPTDFGFYLMAKSIYPAMRMALNHQNNVYL